MSLTDQESEEKIKMFALTEMQGFCGGFGMFLTGIWLYLIHTSAGINVFSLPGNSVWFFVFIGVGFFCATLPLPYFIRRDLSSNNITRARKWLRATSVVCVIFISLIIYASGGPNSPFIMFYTMTFTLTLSKIEKNIEGRALLTFLLPLFFAFTLSYWSYFGGYIEPTAIIPFESIKVLVTQPFHFIMLALGTFLSLIIPTLSIIRFKSKSKKKA